MQGYRGPNRRGTAEECEEIETWRATAASFNSRLVEIERLTKSTHEHLMAHIGQEAKTQQAIVDLLETWHGAKFTVQLVKWLAPILVAIGAFALWAKDHYK